LEYYSIAVGAIKEEIVWEPEDDNDDWSRYMAAESVDSLFLS
jgi:predicted benzoate:H+ symporter BenE